MKVLQSHRSRVRCVAGDHAWVLSKDPLWLWRTTAQRVLRSGRFRLFRAAAEIASKQPHHSNSELLRAPDRLAGPTCPIHVGASVLDLPVGSATNRGASICLRRMRRQSSGGAPSLPGKTVMRCQTRCWFRWRDLRRLSVRWEVWLSQALRGKQVKEFSPTIPIDSAIWQGIEEAAASEKSAIWLEFSLASRRADRHNPPVIGNLKQ